jgi:hypothetical protein
MFPRTNGKCPFSCNDSYDSRDSCSEKSSSRPRFAWRACRFHVFPSRLVARHAQTPKIALGVLSPKKRPRCLCVTPKVSQVRCPGSSKGVPGVHAPPKQCLRCPCVYQKMFWVSMHHAITGSHSRCPWCVTQNIKCPCVTQRMLSVSMRHPKVSQGSMSHRNNVLAVRFSGVLFVFLASVFDSFVVGVLSRRQWVGVAPS